MNNMNKRMKTLTSQFKTRETSDEKRIEGYFSVFDGTYQIGQGMTESIDSHAFDEALDDDIRALINHDSTLVLGRTKSGTLDLKVDEHGLWGSILINPNDQEAMNIYSRVQRGDVNQCSFGFDILKEDTEINDETGDVHWTIKAVKLYEVSVCTFPAYDTTEVEARSQQVDEIKSKSLKAWKERMNAKLKGDK